jgi:hypothetical protein
MFSEGELSSVIAGKVTRAKLARKCQLEEKTGLAGGLRSPEDGSLRPLRGRGPLAGTQRKLTWIEFQRDNFDIESHLAAPEKGHLAYHNAEAPVPKSNL